jgi:beta-N-acetylhexosaminidase
VLRLKERYGLLDAAALARPTPDAETRTGRPEDAALARRIATRSITALGPTSPGLPLPADTTSLIIRPRLGREAIDTEAETVIAGFAGPKTLFLPADPGEAAITQAVEQAMAVKATVLLVTDARRNPGQRRLAEALAAGIGPNLVLVASQSPYDTTLLPQTGVRLATYGEAPASLEALRQSLFAPFRFTGRLPAVRPATPAAP